MYTIYTGIVIQRSRVVRTEADLKHNRLRKWREMTLFVKTRKQLRRQMDTAFSCLCVQLLVSPDQLHEGALADSHHSQRTVPQKCYCHDQLGISAGKKAARLLRYQRQHSMCLPPDETAYSLVLIWPGWADRSHHCPGGCGAEEGACSKVEKARLIRRL